MDVLHARTLRGCKSCKIGRLHARTLGPPKTPNFSRFLYCSGRIGPDFRPGEPAARHKIGPVRRSIQFVRGKIRIKNRAAASGIGGVRRGANSGRIVIRSPISQNAPNTQTPTTRKQGVFSLFVLCSVRYPVGSGSRPPRGKQGPTIATIRPTC